MSWLRDLADTAEQNLTNAMDDLTPEEHDE